MSTNGVRLTKVADYNTPQPGNKRGPRTIPVPWIDCAKCASRHYPSTTRGRWYIATDCVACGAALAGVEELSEL